MVENRSSRGTLENEDKSRWERMAEWNLTNRRRESSMVGHSFQNYDREYAGFSAVYTCLHTLRMGFKLIYTTI